MRWGAGEARSRFGGNIPLIGIGTWGVFQHKSSLQVRSGITNYGYLTRHPVPYEPVKYGREGQRPALDNHHSHFILVDDGTADQFGREIELRGQLEACACSPKGNAEERAIADVLARARMGWEGSRDGWIAAYKARLDAPLAPRDPIPASHHSPSHSSSHLIDAKDPRSVCAQLPCSRHSHTNDSLYSCSAPVTLAQAS